MSKFVDITGQRFGKLVIIKRLPNLKRNATRFLCQCDCGNFVSRLADYLKTGKCTTCGCWRKLPYGESSFRALYRFMKCNSKYRGVEWKLSMDFVRHITKQPCHYCGDAPSQIYFPKRHNGEYIYNGIDRVDNLVGYIEENCVPCCGVCNFMKSATPVQDFRDWIIRVHGHWASK